MASTPVIPDTDTETIEAARSILNGASKEGRLLALIGAGASMGPPQSLPGWDQLVKDMADHAATFQPARAALMRDELTGARDLISAASLFAEGDRVPKTERRHFFEARLRVDPDKLSRPYRILAALPFQHWMTTNFDNGLKHAMAHAPGQGTIEEVRYPNLGPLLATWSDRSSFVYLHGRVSDYDSLVYTRSHFDSAKRNPNYREAVKRAFLENSVLAFGFSFSDPNFIEILRYVADDLGGNTARAHVAILSSDTEVPDNLLHRCNFHVLRYDSPTGTHEEAVSILEELGSGLRSSHEPRPRPTILSRDSDEQLRELSSIYLSILAPSVSPTYETASAAIVARVLLRSPQRALAWATLVKNVSELVHASTLDAETMARSGVEHLARLGHVEDRTGTTHLTSLSIEDPFSRLRPLVEAVEVRAATYDTHYHSTGGSRRAIRYVIAHCMLVQGTTVARAFRNQEAADGYQLSVVITEALRLIDGLSDPVRKVLQSSIPEILRDPAPECSRILFELAHAAYALESVFLNPLSINVGESLRWRMYLDSNVLMRAMVTAHPKHRQFHYILARLRRMGTPLVVLHPFVEEIDGHFRQTGDLVRLMRIRTLGELQNYVSTVPRQELSPVLLWYLSDTARNGWVDFDGFRRRVGAHSLASITSIVESLGAVVEGRDSVREMNTAERETLWDYLRQWRGGQRSQPARRLRRNEATQIVWLVRQREAGIRCWFLSMDSQLRQALKFSNDHRYAGFVMTPIEWAHRLASLHWGEIDTEGFAELMWSAPEARASDRVQYAIMAGVVDALRDEGATVPPEVIRDAVDDYICRGPLQSVIRGAEAADEGEVERTISGILPTAVATIFDAMVRRFRKG